MAEQEVVQPVEQVPATAPEQPRDKTTGRFASVLKRLEENTRINQALRNGDLDPADYDEDAFTPEEFATARNARQRRRIVSTKPEPDRDPHKLAPEPKGDIGFEEFSKMRADGLTGHEEAEATPGAPEQETPEQATERQQFEVQRAKHEDFIHKTAAKMVTDSELTNAMYSIREAGVHEGVVNQLGLDLAELPNGIDVLKALGRAPQLLYVIGNQTLEGGRAFLRALSDEVANGTSRPKVTSAPAPPSPVQARAAGGAFDANDEHLTPEEWARKRNQQVRKGKGR